jgi:hypothetical protein
MPADNVLLVVSLRNPIAADYAAHVRGGDGRTAVVFDDLSAVTSGMLQPANDTRSSFSVVLFLNSQPGDGDRRRIEQCLALAHDRGARFVCIVSSFRVHFDDGNAIKAEEFAVGHAARLSARTVTLRPGHVLSRSSRATANLRRFGAFYPLVPARITSCCVDGDELFEAIERERRIIGSGSSRTYTLLGPNRSWRALFAQHRATGIVAGVLLVFAAVLSWLLVGQIAALVFNRFVRRRSTLRRWNFKTLWPRSFRELLALYNRHNAEYVKVVGYNNGVSHFGHHYPNRTIVSTIYCDRLSWAGADVIKADCGATVRNARDFLAGSERDLHVIPNYSYVCLGTSFFVPIHGSAADYSCMADTIDKVVLYDPTRDQLIVTTREEPAFQEHVYNQRSNVLLLRMYLRVRHKARYFVQMEELNRPTSEDLLRTLRDERATNVEIRKSHASNEKVQVYRYFKDPGEVDSAVLELPRDRIGRVWDRLEENAVTSFLFHTLTRWLAWHMELFFTAEEFATFWQTHAALPLRKIQLRYIRRDGFPHSPFRDHDCVSADLFMFRRHRSVFETYLNDTFAVIRSNPGKHSR